MSNKINLLRLKVVNKALKPLNTKIVFVGGATVSLYADRVAEEVRPTDDVDILIELIAYNDYASIDEKLRTIGFVNDIESGIICRYKIQGITVDVMPTNQDVLGFTNKWYADGFANAIKYKIDEESEIKVLSTPYFLSTKIEAFKSPYRNNNNNGIYSTDFEDIVFLLENRLTIWDDLSSAPINVKQYLKTEFKFLLSNPLFEEWIEAHVSYSNIPATNYIIQNLNEFVNK